MFQKNKGFTLIELLVVIAIIAVLASIALISLAPAQKAGRDARRIADLRQMQSILQLYYNACGFYPGAAISGGTCAGGGIADDTLVAWVGAGGLGEVLEGSALIPAGKTPNDPLAGVDYHYARGLNGTSYVLQAVLETDNNVFQQDTDCTVFGVPCDDANRDYCIQF